MASATLAASCSAPTPANEDVDSDDDDVPEGEAVPDGDASFGGSVGEDVEEIKAGCPEDAGDVASGPGLAASPTRTPR